MSEREVPEKQQMPAMGKVEDFVPAGARLLASQTGDINGDGIEDAVIVIDPPNVRNGQPGSLPSRTTMLLVRDTSGQLRKVAQNDVLVPCAKCGGLMGDPFGYVRIGSAEFVIVIEGGSRQRWSSEYTFRYLAQSNDWYLQEAVRSAYDQISEDGLSKTFTQEDFGRISFTEFDPSMIKEVVLP